MHTYNGQCTTITSLIDFPQDLFDLMGRPYVEQIMPTTYHVTVMRVVDWSGLLLAILIGIALGVCLGVTLLMTMHCTRRR